MNEKIIGIIGGMGPEATAFYYTKLIKKTKVSKDQDHYRVIIDSNAKIPDRTKAILYNEKSPVDEIQKCVDTLNHAKVDIAFITCITSHFFIDQIKEKSNFVIVDALREFEKHIDRHLPKVKNIGILATTGTIKTGLFNRYLTNFSLIYPDDKTQEEKVMAAIYSEDYGIKAGFPQGKSIDLLTEAGNSLIDRGADILVAGCTEIGLVLNSFDFPVHIIDPMNCAIESILSGDIR